MAALREGKEEEEQSVKLLTAWPSPYGMRAVIGLEEMGINYEYVEQTLYNLEQNVWTKSPLLLQMNPVHKKMPVLIHGGRPVAESLVILQYIHDVWASSETAFLPSHPYDRALARFWADFAENKVCFLGFETFRTKGEKKEAVKQEFLNNLNILEGELNGRDYFGGDRFGLVDITLAPWISWFHTIEIAGRFEIHLEEKFPNIGLWRKRCLERESVKKALPSPEKVLEYAIPIIKHFFPEEA